MTKTNKDIEFNSIINQQDIRVENTFHSGTQTDHTLGCKTNLNKFKRTEITECALQPKWNQTRNRKQRMKGEFPNTWNLNSPLQHTMAQSGSTKTKFKKDIEFNENKNKTNQSLWNTEKTVLRGKHC